MDKNCKNCLFRERSYNEYPCEKCRNGNNWTPSDNLLEFAIEELEKLKVKVIALSYDCKICTIDRYEVEKLIDRQIAELKGENNENN